MKSILLIITACAFSACVHFPFTKVANLSTSAPTNHNATSPLWLISGELHCDLVVETKWLIKHGCLLPPSVKPYKYLCFGWGDRVAYTQRWGLDDVPKALFWESESIVQVVAFNTAVHPTFPNHTVTPVKVPSSRGPHLANFLNQSFRFATSHSSSPITLRKAKWGHGYFIASPYTYYAPRMCNQWIATALREAGVYTTGPSPLNSPLTLRSQLRKYKAQQQSIVLQ